MPPLVELGVAHIAEIPEKVGAHAEDNIPQGSLLAAVAQFLQLVPDELLVVEVAFPHLGRHLTFEHLGSVQPLLVGESAANHVAPELAPVGRLGSGAHIGEAAESEGDDGDECEDALGVAGMEPGERVPRAAAEEAEGNADEEGETAAEGTAEEDAEGDGAAEDGGGADREGVHRRLVHDVHRSDPSSALPSRISFPSWKMGIGRSNGNQWRGQVPFKL